jgi:outer membrane protein insertion porin family
VGDRRPGAPKPMADVREDIRKTLETQARSAVMKQWLVKLRAETLVRRFDEGSGIARSADRVVSIEIRRIGVSTADDAAIRSHLWVKASEVVTQASVDHDLRSLYGTGNFYNIRVSAETVTGGIKVIYLVQENPVLTGIRFAGNQNMDSRELLRKLASKTGEWMNECKFFKDTQLIQSLYQTAGYTQATVKYEFAIEEKTGRGQVTFEVNEGPK